MMSIQCVLIAAVIPAAVVQAKKARRTAAFHTARYNTLVFYAVGILGLCLSGAFMIRTAVMRAEGAM